MGKGFKYELGGKVSLIETEECGVIVGRAEYTDSDNSYYIRYKDSTGKQILKWWNETHIVAN